MMDKVILDDKLWKCVFEAAIRFTGDESLRLPIKPGEAQVPVPHNFEEASRLRKKAEAIRVHRLGKCDDFMFFWLVDQSEEEQDEAITRLHQIGTLLEPEKVYDRLYDWFKRDGAGNAKPVEAAKMSDDVLDRWTQYLHINRDLLDDPEMYAEDYIH